MLRSLPSGYTNLSINSFRFNMQADFFVFNIPHHIIDPVRDVILENFSDSTWDSHNIFSIQHETVNNLKECIKNTLDELTQRAAIDYRNNLYILGWLNNLKPGDYIKEHFHSLEKNNYFSCNISLDTYSTETKFYLPWIDRYGDIYSVSNEKGKSCIFPSWVWHSVEDNPGQRYTLGVDFYVQERIEEYFATEHNKSPAPIQYAIPL